MSHIEPETRQITFADVVEALRKGNRERNEWATKQLVEADRALRPKLLACLLHLAADERNRPMYRVRILQVLEKMNTEVGFLGRGMIFRMTYDKSTSVRRAAVKLFKQLMIGSADTRRRNRPPK
ncbi:MAG: hypothetical protein CME33_09415 [Gimesia sp.]|mgnify:CR=1 FL=1|uniref:hypothetical protein n=1 Tax=Gimesia sp. TaxID=2024833 RepID=UPI000C5A6FB2|nr:hypothetical protein [Gimesia sp.]MAX36768.1 hypothetical protein [Gimesia sp.]|tara:strand:- start:834 stop:1205 length:372 start_codon:yes stop_codon:yes gene_type:complete